MAQINKRLSENVDGAFFVDNTCIDCDTCRWMAPEVFRESNGYSVVYHQPLNLKEKTKALQALVSCPTASIGYTEKEDLLNEVVNSFPILIEKNVYHCGFHSEHSYGASSYFIQRDEGNMLVDSPRFAKPLINKLEQMGGIKYLYLTHKDDVADHEKFRKHFNCKRIIHEDDITADTKEVEIKISDQDNFKLENDLLIIPVPGHTKGHTVLLCKNKYLFTGDHLALSRRFGHLVAFKDACWYSWEELIKSMEKLCKYEFEWILPGHGRRFHASQEKMKEEMQRCLEWMCKK